MSSVDTSAKTFCYPWVTSLDSIINGIFSENKMTNHKVSKVKRPRLVFRHALIILLALHIVIISCVYIALPRERLYWTYLPWAWYVVNGIVLGLYRRQTFIEEIVSFTFIEAVVGFGIHLTAAMMGKRVDFGTIESWPIVFLIFLVSLLFALFGSLLGWSFCGLRRR